MMFWFDSILHLIVDLARCRLVLNDANPPPLSFIFFVCQYLIFYETIYKQNYETKFHEQNSQM